MSPQPGNGLCGEEAVEMITLIGCASEIPVEIEEVETIRLQGCAITNRAVDLEQLLLHFEFAEVGRSVSQPFKDRTHVGTIGPKIRDVTKFHLVENAIHLGRLTTEEGGSRRRAHGRCDVVVSEDDAVPFEFIACGQLVMVGGQEMIRLLVRNNEDDVVGLRAARNR